MTKNDDDFSLAFLPLARTTFDMPLAADMIRRARANLESAGFRLRGPENAITDTAEADVALRELAAGEFDAVVVYQATFADSGAVRAIAGAIPAPLLLWAVPEEPSGGRLRLNSYCGVNLAAHALKRAGIRYESVYAGPDAPDAPEKIRRMAAAGSVVRRLRDLRIGRLGTNPDGFESCLMDPAALKRRFGVEVTTLDLERFFADVEGVNARDIAALRESLRDRVGGLDQVERIPADRTLASYLLLEQLARRHRLDGFAVRCWPEFFTRIGCAACGALSLLSDRGIPAGCESDVNGVVTQWILQTVAGAPAFDTDVVAIDEEADAVVFWHCGKAPLSLADPQETPQATIHSNRKLPLLWEFPLKPGTVTLARLSAASGDYKLTMAKGEMIRSAKSFTGTSGRCRFARPAREFLERILAEGLEHHMALAYGDHGPTLRLLAQELELPVLEI